MVESPDQSLHAQDLRTALEAQLGPQLAPLRRLRLGRRLLDLAGFGGLYAAGAAFAVWGAADGGLGASAAAVVLCALAMNAFILLLHEGMHRILFAHPAANRWAAVLLGAFGFIGFSAYQAIHDRHHRYLGDTRDPDHYRNYSHRPAVLATLQTLRLTVGVYPYLVAIPALAFWHGSARVRIRVATEYALLAALWTAAFLLVPLPILVRAWLLPVVLVGFMTQVRGFSQHAFTDPRDPRLASRTVRANPVTAFLVLHENHHLEHHIFPEVPSYNLQALHRLVLPRLEAAAVSPSYLSVLLRFVRSPGTSVGPVEAPR